MKTRALLRTSFAVALVVTSAARRARAEDYVTVRGAYYREPSTRVIQPTVELERDSPTGWDVKAHYLVDTITSASAAAGTSVDSIFTETRNEAALAVRKRWDRSELTASYKYSAESDYWSHAFGLSGAQRFWGDTATVGLSVGASLDTLSSRFRTPACATYPSISCSLDSYFAGLSYTQILSPVALVQVSLESSFIDGFQGNLYRSGGPDHEYENLPGTRLRNAFAARVAYYIPRAQLALRLQYRYYVDATPWASTSAPWVLRTSADDPWHVYSHTIEARVYRPLTSTLSARLSYRQYFQWGANFWCDTSVVPGCYAMDAAFYSTDPKLGRVRTEYPEVELIWQAEALHDVPVLGWISAGTFTISYGRYFQNTSFGDAHVLQAGYTLPY